MLESLFFKFIEAWLMGLIAFIAGRLSFINDYDHALLPSGMGRTFLTFLQVWAITFIAQLAFSSLGNSWQWKESVQSGFAEFLLPLATGAYFARRLLRVATQRDKQ